MGCWQGRDGAAWLCGAELSAAVLGAPVGTISGWVFLLGMALSADLGC